MLMLENGFNLEVSLPFGRVRPAAGVEWICNLTLGTSVVLAESSRMLKLS